jgi:hypothetical protein
MNLPASRFRNNPEQAARNARGVEMCRAAIAPHSGSDRVRPEPETPLTKSEEIHLRALERAAAERVERTRHDRLRKLGARDEAAGRVPRATGQAVLPEERTGANMVRYVLNHLAAAGQRPAEGKLLGPEVAADVAEEAVKQWLEATNARVIRQQRGIRLTTTTGAAV